MGKWQSWNSLKFLCQLLSIEGPAEQRLCGTAVSQHHPSVRLEDVFSHRCKGVSLGKPSGETFHEVSLLTSVEPEELLSKCELPISIFRYFSYFFSITRLVTWAHYWNLDTDSMLVSWLSASAVLTPVCVWQGELENAECWLTWIWVI